MFSYTFIVEIVSGLLNKDELIRFKSCSVLMRDSMLYHGRPVVSVRVLDEFCRKRLRDSFLACEVDVVSEFDGKFGGYPTIVGVSIGEQSVIDGEELVKLSKLRSLRVNGTLKVEDEHLLKLTNLKRVELFGTEITGVGLNAMKIETLRVKENDAFLLVELARFKNLRNLEISHCCGITRPTLENLIGLTSLIFRGENIDDQSISKLVNLRDLTIITPGCVTDVSIRRLTNLTSLCLNSYANIVDYECKYDLRFIGRSFARLVNLRKLVISNPVERGCFGELKLLEELTIERQCSKIVDEDIRHLRQLRYLQIDAEGVKGICFHNFSKLEALVLESGNDVIYKYVDDLTRLTMLRWDGGMERVTGVYKGEIKFGGLGAKLRVLDLGMKATVGDAALTSLSKLEVLTLARGHRIIGECFPHLTSLRELNLHRNNFITDFNLNYCTGLRVLNISGTVQSNPRYKRVITKNGLFHLQNVTDLNLCLNRDVKLEDVIHLGKLRFLHIVVGDGDEELRKKLEERGVAVSRCLCER
ncbi:MAG: hypothetical protein Harvfovirus2_60 [Harvfovirus sp.]|uniref:Leucine-rich repeat protein n=1 Tax=Harvfovirus sp. TaxID=2487768 RepID=A0A3G5A079_9VIRU|nr:MAG: hypothetical protein Harvfovirus2_60 [Harvfovirus sp.]